MIWRVILAEEFLLFRAVIECLISGDKNPRIFLRMQGIDFGCVITKRTLEIGEAVIAQLGAVAHEQRFANQPRIEKFPEQRCSKPRFAGASGEWKHHSPPLPCAHL